MSDEEKGELVLKQDRQEADHSHRRKVPRMRYEVPHQYARSGGVSRIKKLHISFCRITLAKRGTEITKITTKPKKHINLTIQNYVIYFIIVDFLKARCLKNKKY
jgi:hypothetical protein